ncbi:MAG: hypothetical protein AB7F59_09685 [Bdellovibrionales bacterium]
MVHAMIEAVTRWIRPHMEVSQMHRVIVVESSGPNFVLGPMLAKVLHKPYFDLRHGSAENPSGFCIVSKSELGKNTAGYVIVVDDVLQDLKENGASSSSPLVYQCLRIAMLRIADYRRQLRSTSSKHLRRA